MRSNSVQAVNEVRRSHALYGQGSVYSGHKRFAHLHEGHSNPLGHRTFVSTSAHCCSFSIFFRNFAMLNPFCSRTRSRAALAGAVTKTTKQIFPGIFFAWTGRRQGF